MAFGQKTAEQILAEEFPGKTKAQIQEMIASFDDLKTKAAKVDSLEAIQLSSTEELKTVKEKLLQLETNSQRGRSNDEPPNTPTKPDWGEDADAAFNDRSKPLANLALETRAEIIYDRVVNRLREEDPYFPKLRKDFDALIQAEKNPVVRAQQAFVENCYNVVFARKRTEILRDVKAGSGEYFVETGRNQNNNQHDYTPPDNSKSLSEEEKREARKFGLTEEKWLETRNKIKFVGGSLQNM